MSSTGHPYAGTANGHCCPPAVPPAPSPLKSRCATVAPPPGSRGECPPAPKSTLSPSPSCPSPRPPRVQDSERSMGNVAYRGKGFKERARVSDERPIGAASFRQHYIQASYQHPPPPRMPEPCILGAPPPDPAESAVRCGSRVRVWRWMRASAAGSGRAGAGQHPPGTSHWSPIPRPGLCPGVDLGSGI